MTNNYSERIAQNENPFVATAVNELDGSIDSVYELKFGLVFYTTDPPGPKRAQAVFDLFTALFPGRIAQYAPTVPGSLPLDWKSGTESEFRNRLLPDLRRGPVWGYAFEDGRDLDSTLFMFHGFRPVTEPGKASFFRFEFPWNVAQAKVKLLAAEIARSVPFENGFGGYFLKPAVDRSAGYGAMYAICHRFWGVEPWNLEMSVEYALSGYAGVNWLTVLGESLRAQNPKAVEDAKRVAFGFEESQLGVILQAEERAGFCDRNRRETLPGYEAVAKALLPLQVKAYGSFGGELWDEDNSMNYLRRFTHPDSV